MQLRLYIGIMKMTLFLLLASITIACTSYAQVQSGQLTRPVQRNDGIKTADLPEVGLELSVIQTMQAELLADSFPNIHSVLIYKKGNLVFEQYFKGKDERWGDSLGVIEHKYQDLHDIRSISKSVVSACIGIAIAQGKIQNVKQRIFDFFPNYSGYDTGLKKNLTIEHLLTMTSGFEWNEDVPYTDPRNSEIQMDNSKDPIDFVLSRPLTSQPGTLWKYNGGTTELLAAIIEKTTGKKVDEFAKIYLFTPIGIKDFEWVRFPGTVHPAAASGLRLRSRDLLKFGILYLQNGIWNNKPVIPGAWVKASHKMYITRPDSGGYGYQFWILNDTLNNKSKTWPAAVGNGDQRIFFDSENELLVVVTAGNYNLWNIRNGSFQILKKVYPAFK